MHDDKRIASFFFRVDNIFNKMKGHSDKIKYIVFVENILRSLTPKFNSKVSST